LVCTKKGFIVALKKCVFGIEAKGINTVLMYKNCVSAHRGKMHIMHIEIKVLMSLPQNMRELMHLKLGGRKGSTLCTSSSS